MSSTPVKEHKASPPPKGIYVPVPTFFAPDSTAISGSRLDLETQSKHTRFLVEGGVRGLVILGSTGEAIVISRSERRELISSQREVLDKAGFTACPIIAGTATQGIEDTLEAIQDSKEAGAEYAMVLAPGYFASLASQAGIQKWFELIADHSLLPVLIYHYPGVTNNIYIAPSTFERLASHPNIVGTKLSHGMVADQILVASSPTIDHESFYTFTGLGQLLLPFLTIGGAAAIDGLAGCFPRTVVRLYQLFCESQSSAAGLSGSKLSEMRNLQYSITEAEKLVERWGVIGIKEALVKTWQIGESSNARLPLSGGFPDGEIEWKKWSGIFEKLKKFENSLLSQK